MPRMPDPFFILQCYQDAARLSGCLARLRRHYPRTRVLVISDGCADPAIPRICADHGVGFELGKRLFTHEHGGAAMHRLLVRFLEGREPVMIKIDPDTEVCRPLDFTPAELEHAKVLGVLQSTGTGSARMPGVQGGCILVNRPAAERIVASGALLHADLGPPRYVWAVSPSLLRRAQELGLTSHDWTLAYVCKALGIPIEAKAGIFSVWKPTFRAWLGSRGHRIVHPRMTLWLCLRAEVGEFLGRWDQSTTKAAPTPVADRGFVPPRRGRRG